jgi:ATP-dependent Clp protease ATP-binding subunit ClpC
MIEYLAQYRDKFSEKAHELISFAIEESKRRQHFYLGVEHLFLAFTRIERGLYDEILRELAVDDPNLIERQLKERLSIRREYTRGGLKITDESKEVFSRAWEFVQKSNRRIILSTDVFRSIFEVKRSFVVQMFSDLGVTPERMIEEITYQYKLRDERERDIKRKYELPPYLKQYAVNLSRLAALDRLPIIIGREQELDRMIEVLCHKDRPNSVMITGEAGVGKTALAEGLARRFEQEPDRVPARLRKFQIINLQMNSLVAGTMFRGMFEDRIEKILKEIREKNSYIIFIDEAHSLIGAGSALGVPSDAANIFKSALARGELQMIGATTTTEYKTFFLEDEALARRFREVKLSEPNREETREILLGIRPRLERNYSVEIDEGAINIALDMADRYNRGLRMPDKVINWLDTASVRVELSPDREVVRAQDVLDVISRESKIPLDMVCRDTNERFRDIEQSLENRVVGQREALEAVAKRLRLNKGPLKQNYDQPDGVLLFLGPTGVGKTETARALAEFLFGDEKKLVRLDMTEYKDGAMAVDKLIGMPRGIVGSERGGILTNLLRDNPSSVVLLDEVEKAHPYVLNLFLQVFDEGWLTDGRGKKVYFSDAIIIMTSNLGSHEFRKFTKPLGFLEDSVDIKSIKSNVMRELENSFAPEFLNRIDEVVVFSPLMEKEVGQITRMYLDTIVEHMKKQGKILEYSEASLQRLAEVGFSIKYGARFLKRMIDQEVKIPLTLKWHEGSRFMLDIGSDGKISVETVTEGDPVLVC